MVIETHVSAHDAIDPIILAIDVGSSSARSIAYDGNARMLEGFESHHPYPILTSPDGGVTVEPDPLVDQVFSSIDEVMESVRRSGRRVAAVATDTFWHSLIGTDDQGRAMTPAYVWADTRSSGEAVELKRLLDEDAVHGRTGAVFHSSYWPAKLLWLRHVAPDLVKRVSFWMSFAEYLFSRLFGMRRVSISMASGTGLFDQHSCTWDQEVLDALAVPPAQLSEVGEFTETLTGMRDPYDKRWPELESVPWYLPLGDGACSNVGAGGIGPEWLVAMIGTSGALRLVREAKSFDIPKQLWTYRVDRDRIVQGGALSDGGNVFAWLVHLLQLGDIALLEESLEGMAPDAHGLTVLPFLAGERSPHWNPDVKSALVGMTLDTRAVDIVRAELEAVAYRFEAVYAALRKSDPGERGIIGSGAALTRSPVWMQILSDVLGEPLIESAVPEASSRGAALLVLEAMGKIIDLQDLPAPLGKTYEPSRANTKLYRAAIERQESLYRRLIGNMPA